MRITEFDYSGNRQKRWPLGRGRQYSRTKIGTHSAQPHRTKLRPGTSIRLSPECLIAANERLHKNSRPESRLHKNPRGFLPNWQFLCKAGSPV